MSIQPLQSTTLVIYGDKDQIIAGSDGLAIIGTNSFAAPKIRFINNQTIIVGLAGVSKMQRHDSVFEANVVLESVLRETNALSSQILKAIEIACSNSLVSVLNGPECEEARQSIYGTTLLQLAFAHWSKGVPEIDTLHFAAKTNNSFVTVELISQSHEVYSASNGIPIICIIGQNNVAARYGLKKEFWAADEPTNQVAKLINMEIEADTDNWVGFPIFLYRLEKSGNAVAMMITKAAYLKRMSDQKRH